MRLEGEKSQKYYRSAVATHTHKHRPVSKRLTDGQIYVIDGVEFDTAE